MSKKDKSKFKKQLKAQRLQEISRNPNTTVSQPQTATKVTLSPSATIVEPMSVIGNLTQIKYDLKKTGVVVLSLAMIIAVLYFLDNKYNILLEFGNWLFKVLNIQ